MANTTLTDLPENTNPDLTDLLYSVVDVTGTPDSKKLTLANLKMLMAPDYICIQDQKAQNTNGGTFTSGDWRTRDLNVEQSDSGGHASVASNQITLAAGTYICSARAPAAACEHQVARLYNVTDAAVILSGTSRYLSTGDTALGVSEIHGKFTIAASKVIEVQHYCSQTRNTNGFGVASNLAVEIYTVIELWKVA